MSQCWSHLWWNWRQYLHWSLIRPLFSSKLFKNPCFKIIQYLIHIIWSIWYWPKIELAYSRIRFTFPCRLTSLASSRITFIENIIVICVPLWIRYCLKCTRALKLNFLKCTSSNLAVSIFYNLLYYYVQESPSRIFHHRKDLSIFDCFDERGRKDNKNIQKSLPTLKCSFNVDDIFSLTRSHRQKWQARPWSQIRSKYET